MASATAPTGWATPEEWATNRDIIAHLYIDEKRKLKDVMRIMREEHNFHATEKMYKIRLNKWGLQKYLRHQTPESFRHGRRALGKQADQFLDRAAPLQQKRSHVISVTTGSTAVTAPKPMTPRVLTTPDPWRLPEECVFISYNFLNGTFDSGQWAPPENREHVVTWIGQVAIGSNVLSRSMTKMGFSMLDVCFANFRKRLTSTEPHLISDILVAMAQFSRSSDALVDAFLNYASDLCNILYPSGHPVRIFLNSLRKQGWRKVKPHVQSILAAYWDTARKHSDPNDPYLDLQECYTTFLGMVAGWINGTEAVDAFYAVLQRRQAMGLEDPVTEHMIYRHLVLMLPRLGRKAEARGVALRVLGMGCFYSPATTNAYAILSLLAELDDELEEAIQWARHNLQFSLQTWGVSNHRAAQTLIELIQLLSKADRLGEAKELVQFLGLTWEEFGHEIENTPYRPLRDKKYSIRPSMMHIKGFHARFRQAFDELKDGEVGTYANSPPPASTPDLSALAPADELDGTGSQTATPPRVVEIRE